MRRLEFGNSSEFKDYIPAFVNRLTQIENSSKIYDDSIKIPMATLARYHEDDLQTGDSIKEPLYSNAHVQGAILELVDMTDEGRRSIYSPSLVVIQKFVRSMSSNNNPRMKMVRAVWKQKRQPHYYLIENKTSLSNSPDAYDITLVDRMQQSHSKTRQVSAVARRLLGEKATYVELALTPMIIELEKTISQTNGIVLKDLVADFKFAANEGSKSEVKHRNHKKTPRSQKKKWYLTSVVAFSADKGCIDASLLPVFSKQKVRRPSTTPFRLSRKKSQLSKDIRAARLNAVKRRLLPADFMKSAKAIPETSNDSVITAVSKASQYDNYTTDTRANDILNEIYRKSQNNTLNGNSRTNARRRPRTTNAGVVLDGIHQMLNSDPNRKKCPGRFCDPYDLNHQERFVQMPYKILAFERCASRLRPSKRWTVTEASISVEDRYRLNDVVYVCGVCHNEYTNREISRRDQKKTHLADVTDGDTIMTKFLDRDTEIKKVISNIQMSEPAGWNGDDTDALNPLHIDSLTFEGSGLDAAVAEVEEDAEELVTKKASIVLDDEEEDICLICFKKLKVCKCM